MHKNLMPDENLKNREGQFQKIKSALEKLISIYHPKEGAQIALAFSGEEGGVLDFVPLYRILNNIVKNMAEAQITDAQFQIDFSAAGLCITTQNQMTDKNTIKQNEGLGLLSIAALASEVGGIFQYEIHGDLWVNHLFLPYKNSSSTKDIKKIAA